MPKTCIFGPLDLLCQIVQFRLEPFSSPDLTQARFARGICVFPPFFNMALEWSSPCLLSMLPLICLILFYTLLSILSIAYVAFAAFL